MRRSRLVFVAAIVLLALLGTGMLCSGQEPEYSGDLARAKVESIWDFNAFLTSRQSSVSQEARLGLAGTPFRSSKQWPGEPDQQRPIHRSKLLIGLYATQEVLQVLDAHSTLRAVGSGTAREGNPVVSPLASHPAALVGFKLGLAGGTILGIDRLHKRHPLLAVLTLAAINGGYAYVVQRNYRSFPGH